MGAGASKNGGEAANFCEFVKNKLKLMILNLENHVFDVQLHSLFIIGTNKKIFSCFDPHFTRIFSSFDF